MAHGYDKPAFNGGPRNLCFEAEIDDEVKCATEECGNFAVVFHKPTDEFLCLVCDFSVHGK